MEASRSSSTNRSPGPQSIPVPGSSRSRNPPPPSPLSQINSPVSDTEQQQSHRARLGPPPSGVALSPPATIPEPLTSPCYIHSYLDKHGSGTLADYLNHHGHGGKHDQHGHAQQQPQGSARRSVGGQHAPASAPNGLGQAMEAMNIGGGSSGGRSGQSTSPDSMRSGAQYGHAASTPVSREHSVKHPARHTARFQHHSPSGSHQPQSQASGVDGDARSRHGSVSGGSEYGGSDRSTSAFHGMGSGVLDGDFDEDGGSLTKQLAETAQGVREMSRELGTSCACIRVP